MSARPSPLSVSSDEAKRLDKVTEALPFDRWAGPAGSTASGLAAWPSRWFVMTTVGYWVVVSAAHGHDFAWLDAMGLRWDE